MLSGGVDEEGGDDARIDGFRRRRQRWETPGFKPATGRHRCQVTHHFLRISFVPLSGFLYSFFILCPISDKEK